jgi:hypothetical protein
MELYQTKIQFNKNDYGFVFSAGTTNYDDGLEKLKSGDNTLIRVIGPSKKIGIMLKQRIKDIGIYQDVKE